MVKIGDRAPDFNARTHSGENFNLYDALKQNGVVLYFYPKDFTSGCTAEACAFRDSYSDFERSGFIVVGVSGDDDTRHTEFAARYRLPMKLISDSDGKLRRLYGVRNVMGIIPARTTFIIGRDGKVIDVINSLTNPKLHVVRSLSEIVD